MQGKTKTIEISLLVVQFEGIRGDIDSTFSEKVWPLLNPLYEKKTPLDIIVLPECALTGYTFKERADMEGLAEVKGQGKQFEKAKEIAIKMNSYVAMGYIEKGPESADSSPCPLYNSCYLIDRSGSLLASYSKILMFETDKRYFTPGKDRVVQEMVSLSGDRFKAGLGICMDINYKDFENFFEFELGEYGRDQDLDCLLFPTAWTVSGETELSENPEIECEELYCYWQTRLLPMLNSSLTLPRGPKIWPRLEKEWVFAAADRVGREDETLYKGFSGVMVLNRGNNGKEIKGTLGPKEPGVCHQVVKLKRE